MRYLMPALLCVACHSGETPDAKPKGPAPATAAARIPDPGPRYHRTARQVAPENLPDAEAKVAGWLAADGHAYLAFPLPDGVSGTEEPASLALNVEGDRHGFAVVAADATGKPQVLVRLAGADAPADVTVTLLRAASMPHRDKPKPGAVQKVVAKGASAAPKADGLDARFFAAASAWFDRHGTASWHGAQPFYRFASSRLSVLPAKKGPAGKPAAKGTEVPRRTDIADLMNLYSGAESIEEALQSDRGLLLRGAPAQDRTVPLADVQALSLTAHPWDKLLADLKKSPTVEPLARYVPQDVLYVHFHDLRQFVAIARELDEWITPLGRLAEGSAGERHFTDTLETQLAVERTLLSEKLGNLAASGVALIAGDPYLREGTDVALLFQVKDRALLEGTLGVFEANAKAKRPDVAATTYKIGEREVRLFGTADRTIEQHRLWIDDQVLVIANSRAALERLVAVKDGKRPPLADAGDFKYLRAVYPFDPQAEDGFVFIGDAAVQAVTAPASKILEARRMEADADLRAVAYAALLYGWLEGKRPESLDALVASGLLDPKEKTHADGSPIAFDPERGPSSSFGRMTALVPLAEQSIDKVTPAEKDAYDRFRNSYETYWRRYLDPIAVRVRRVDDGRDYELDARMLPLVSGTEYDDLTRMVGATTVGLASPGDGLRFTFAIGKDASLRRDFDQMGQMMTGHSEIGLSWLGDWAMAGFNDHSALWDALLQTGEVAGFDANPDAGPEDAKEVLARLPVYAGVHVRDKLALGATLTALRAFQQQAAKDMVEWTDDKPYRDVSVTVIREKVEAGSKASPLALYYALPRDVLVLALNRPTLEAQIEEVLGGRVPGADPKAPAAQAAVEVRPAGPDGWLVRSGLALMESDAVEGNDAARLAEEALVRGRGAPADADAHRRAGLDWLGEEPVSPYGGAFKVGDHGVITHAVYGSALAPSIPEQPVPGGSADALLKRLASVRMSLGFEGEGDSRGLHAALSWANRAGP
jgi:hypothetical protein